MTRRLPLFAVLAFLVACDDTTLATPVVDQVFPGAVATGRSPYVLIEGQDFDPRFVFRSRDGLVVADTAYTVLFGDTEAPAVHYADRNALVAAVPTTLAARRHTVTVRAPTGREASLESSLCVGEGVPTERVHLCPYLRGAAEQVIRICVTPFGDPLTSVVPISGVTVPSYMPFALSPDGEVVAYFAEQNAAGRIPLVLVRPWGDQVEHVAAELASLADEAYAPAPPVFSPDGRFLAYVDGGDRLMVLDLPNAGEPPATPRTLVSVAPQVSIASPSIDPSTRWVMFSVVRGKDVDPTTALGEVHRLARVPLAGGTAEEIFPESPDGQSDGPGVFLASGDRILFQSDRLGLRTPFGGSMPKVSLLYVLDLSSGEVSPVTEPMNVVYLSQLEVSPDGRWAAGTGHLSDLEGSAIDMILTNLDTGETFRAETDPQLVCNGTTPDNCPTFDLTPAFSPDSSKVVGSAVQYEFIGGNITGIYVYEVDLPTAPLNLPPGRRTLDPASVRRLPVDNTAFPVNVRTREALTGCGP